MPARVHVCVCVCVGCVHLNHKKRWVLQLDCVPLSHVMCDRTLVWLGLLLARYSVPEPLGGCFQWASQFYCLQQDGPNNKTKKTWIEMG